MGRLPAIALFIIIGFGSTRAAPAREELPWDPAYRRGHDAVSAQTHRDRLLGEAPSIPGLEPDDARAVFEEIELRFLRHRIRSIEDYSLGVETILRFLETPRAPWVTALARSHLGFYHWKLGHHTEAWAEWQRVGYLEDFWIIGPFDNERGSGFAQAYGPEREAFSPDRTYLGKRQEVTWRQWQRPGRGGLLELGELLRPNEETLAYLVTHVRPPRAGVYWLRLDTSSAYALSVNGVEVARRDVERPLRFGQDAVAVSLAAGWNRLRVKSAHGKGRWAIRLRLTDAEGAPIPALAVQSQIPGEALAEPPAGSASETDKPFLGASSLLAEADPTAEVLLLRGWLRSDRHPHDRSQHPDREDYRAAIEKNPDHAVAHFLLAGTFKSAVTHQAEREENQWRRELEQTVALDPSFHRARVALARYYLDRFGNRTRAESWLAPALATVGNETGPPSPYVALSARIQRERFGTVAAVPEEATLDARLESEAALARRTGAARRHWRAGRPVVAEELLREGRRRDATHLAASRLLISLLVETDRSEEARGVLEELTSLYPVATRRWRAISEFEFARERWTAALEALDQALLIAPDAEGLHRRRGEVLLLQERRAAALAAFARSLELDPNQPRLREYVATLETGAPDLAARFRVDPAPIIARALAHEDEENLPARLLLENTAVELNLDGTTRRYRQHIFKILNDTGVRQLDTYAVPYAQGEQWVQVKTARVHRSNGTTEDARIRNRAPRARAGEYPVWSRAWVDLPPLEQGDVVEIEYRQEDLRQSFFGDYFGDRVAFAGELPRERTIYTLVAPEGRQLYFHPHGLTVEPTRVVADGQSLWRWDMTKTARIDMEPGMPPLGELVPTLWVSTFEDWNDFGRWYAGLIRRQFEPSADIREKVRELTADRDTVPAKVRAIYDFVVTDIRYIAWEFGVHGFKPYRASTIFARRFGDCKDKATLMCTMLAEIGVKAHPVLIERTRTREQEDLSLPLVNHFNHCIVYVPDIGDGTAHFLDGTAEHHEFEQLPLGDRGAEVLIVRDDGADRATIPWNRPQDQFVLETGRIAIHTGGDAVAESELQLRGDYAVSVRSGLEIEGERVSRLERGLGSRFPGARVVEVETSPLEDLEQPVRVRMKVEIPEYLDDSGDEIKLPTIQDFFGTTAILRSQTARGERTHELMLGNPRLSELVLEIELPKGYRVSRLPEAVTLDDPHASFQFEAVFEGRKLTLRRTLEVRAPRVSVDDYAAFKKFADEVERIRQTRIVLDREKVTP